MSVPKKKLKRLREGEGLIVYENLAVVPRAYTIPANSTVLAEEPLEAMASIDPRQYTIVARSEWPLESVSNPLPGALTPAAIVEYRDLEVVVRAEVGESSWLVLNDTHFNGWEAFARRLAADSEFSTEDSREIIRVNGNFRGVLL